jgi:hypothetical protein
MQAAVVNPQTKQHLNPTGQRIYKNEHTFPGAVPAKWPLITGSPAHACVSIRPDLKLLNAGKLNGALEDFLGSAPAGPTSLLGLWHEASTLGPAMIYKGLITAGELREAQMRVHELAAKTNVKVGAIDVVGILQPTEWMSPGLDFYACDIYDDKHCAAVPYTMLGKFKDQCDELNKAHGPATIAVTETNTRCKARRPFWFHIVWSWLQTRGFTSNTSCFLTFWRPKATESGGWVPSDQATIDVLNAIFEQSKP